MAVRKIAGKVGAFFRRFAGKKGEKKIPKILVEKRVGKANIQKRDWSRNPLGPAFLKKPEPMKRGKFYSSGERTGDYRKHKLLEEKISHLLGVRPLGQYGIVFYKGNSEAYYVRLKGPLSDKSFVYFRVDKRKIREGIDFLFE